MKLFAMKNTNLLLAFMFLGIATTELTLWTLDHKPPAGSWLSNAVISLCFATWATCLHFITKTRDIIREQRDDLLTHCTNLLEALKSGTTLAQAQRDRIKDLEQQLANTNGQAGKVQSI